MKARRRFELYRGDRVAFITAKYCMHSGKSETNVYWRTMDYPDEFANGYHVMLDTDELATVRWDQVKALFLS